MKKTKNVTIFLFEVLSLRKLSLKICQVYSNLASSCQLGRSKQSGGYPKCENKWKIWYKIVSFKVSFSRK